jgi:hypothetical protein
MRDGLDRGEFRAMTGNPDPEPETTPLRASILPMPAASDASRLVRIGSRVARAVAHA